MNLVFVAGLVSTWAMVGLIWTMQLVHYPMLAAYSAVEPATAVADHQRRITPIVGPLMAVEAVTALTLLVSRPETLTVLSAWIAALLLGVALLSTAVIQVPLHTRLAAGHDRRAASRLISTNWIRTVAWTGRAVVLAMAAAT